MFKDNDCTKCHAVDKTKKGPSLKKKLQPAKRQMAKKKSSKTSRPVPIFSSRTAPWKKTKSSTPKTPRS
ncbi:c-type cytochrome [Rhodoferax sp.]|uniref:c-type cytochrome n=1 Tax=Rhodoferax sp. TaxID=50421 RepID=UPI0025F182B4|nr:c-type cytochrome [Rhodoferax sp.]MCM2296149.1 hypothetical protein [Rhodoferax sp.]